MRLGVQMPKKQGACPGGAARGVRVREARHAELHDARPIVQVRARLRLLARISHQANRTRSTTGPANDNEGFSVRRGAAGAPSDTLRPAAESDRRRWDTPRPSGASPA